MSETEVKELMESATTEADWNAKCDQVKRSHGGDYPEFWFQLIVASGLAGRVAAGFAKYN